MFIESACAIAVVLMVVVTVIAITAMVARKNLRAFLDAAVNGALYAL
jgi:hypothetical protein